MSGFTYTFRRVEKKYPMDAESFVMLAEELIPRLVPDSFGRSTVMSLYLDTPDYRMIRDSLETPNFKQKLRLRSYGQASGGSRVFFESKCKVDGVVYKRRLAMSLRQALGYLDTREMPADTQIMREFDYTMRLYGWPAPSALILCERTAFFLPDDPSTRITFDTGIRARTGDRLALDDGTDGVPLLPEGTALMEIKTGGGLPLWLSEMLGGLGIFPRPFSKYGTAYTRLILPASAPVVRQTGPQPRARSLNIKGDTDHA